MVQHGACHRQFTREQGIFTIQQQCTHLALHLLAANIDAQTDVLEFPSLEEFREALAAAARQGRPYDFAGVTCVTAYLRKARRMCEVVKEVSPGTATVVGGGGALAVGDLMAPFADHHCRGEGVAFMRELLGQDTAAPVEHPAVWSVHFPNMIFGYESNDAAFSLAVTLGCHRGCDFCATSAQFQGRRIPILETAEQIMAAMERAERHLQRTNGSVPSVSFVIFDENFLSDPKLSGEFLRLNRERLSQGKLFLPLLFSDATSVGRFTPEQLLEMGVDALWIGMECADTERYDKNRDVDFGRLVRSIQDNGIKVFLSFIAGLEEQTRESIDRDIEYALTLGAAGYQYAMACPMPGTPAYARLQRQGMLDIRRPEEINMSHYYIRHPSLTPEVVKDRTNAFQRRDYERHGPLALRYMKLRLSGLRRHRASDNPALRTRARGFRNDLMFSVPGAAVGKVLGPNPLVRADFAAMQRTIRDEVPLLPVLLDMLRGRAAPGGILRLLLFTHPLTEPLARWVVICRALGWDPRTRDRCGTLGGLLTHLRDAMDEVRSGMMPWDQPELVQTHYPLEEGA